MTVALHASCNSLCLLLCISLLCVHSGTTASDTCAGQPVSEMSDHISMLQVGFDMQKQKPKQVLASGQEQTDAWRNKDYILVPIHKSGTVMCDEAAHRMQEVLIRSQKSDGKKIPYLDNSWYSFGFAQNKSADTERMFNPNDACYMQESRNPFEMVVSSYLFNKAAAEGWVAGATFEQCQKTRPDDCDVETKDGRVTQGCDPDPHASDPNKKHASWPVLVHYVQMAAVYRATVEGPLAKFLPPAKLNETYLTYLRRVPMDAGLIADFVWNNNQSFPTMTYTKNFFEGKPCSLSTCYSGFEDSLPACQAKWNEVLKTFEIPQPMQGKLARAAALSCPAVSKGAKKHDSHQWMDKQNMTHPPEAEMVTRLRELDRTVLNGTIAALEKFYGCPPSSKYREKGNPFKKK